MSLTKDAYLVEQLVPIRRSPHVHLNVSTAVSASASKLSSDGVAFSPRPRLRFKLLAEICVTGGIDDLIHLPFVPRSLAHCTHANMTDQPAPVEHALPKGGLLL